MRIVCPACAAAYEVPEHKLSGRRAVRCASCGQSWTPESLLPPAPPPAPPEPPEPPPPLVSPPSPLRAERPQDPPPLTPAPVVPLPPTRLMLAWAGSLLLVTGGIAAVLGAHGPIAHAWPPMQRFYRLIGLH